MGPVPSLLLDFMPQTWMLPQQLAGFLAAAQSGGRKAAYIVKPDAGCQVSWGGASGRPKAEGVYIEGLIHAL
jgi:hypothetical protein